MKNSKFLSLHTRDWLNAFWMFLISTVISVVGDAILQAITAGNYSLSAIHWKSVAAAIVVAVITYIQKQWATNSKGQVFKKETDQ